MVSGRTPFLVDPHGLPPRHARKGRGVPTQGACGATSRQEKSEYRISNVQNRHAGVWVPAASPRQDRLLRTASPHHTKDPGHGEPGGSVRRSASGATTFPTPIGKPPELSTASRKEAGPLRILSMLRLCAFVEQTPLARRFMPFRWAVPTLHSVQPCRADRPASASLTAPPVYPPSRYLFR